MMLNKMTHYAGALVRGITSGTLIRTANRYLRWRRLERMTEAHVGLTVQSGPFAGMKYIRVPPAHGFIPKLFGMYEQELHGLVDDLVENGYTTLINVGSAEGYYAVGIALRDSQVRVYAFDIDLREQDQCRALAQANHVESRVTIGARCDCADFERLIDDKTLIVMDCESCEYELLDLERAPSLKRADILVEIHEYQGGQNGANVLTARFAATHDSTVIPSVPRRAEDYPALNFLRDPAARQRAVTEREGHQDWIFFRSRQ